MGGDLVGGRVTARFLKIVSEVRMGYHRRQDIGNCSSSADDEG